MRKLVATADVVIVNLPPDTPASMGLDYASLTAIQPDIILTATTAYGSGGPHGNRVGFNGGAQAMSGNMSPKRRRAAEGCPIRRRWRVFAGTASANHGLGCAKSI